MTQKKYDIGHMVAVVMEEHRLKQWQLADMCHVRRETIARIETGQFNVSVEVLAKVVDAMGLRIMLEPND